MEVIRDGDPCPHPPEGSVVTIGVYDGVHLGHRAVIAEVKLRAAELGARSAVVTFDRHPAAVVRPESAPLVLTDLDQRLARIKATGVDYTVVITFDEARAAESAKDFVEQVLVECLNARGVVVGEDFHFGHRRAGNVALLQEMGAVHRFEVEPLGLVAPTGEREPVSSTAIRQALARGDLEAATAMLGRYHEVWGVVVVGDRRGRQLGFPTANVAASPRSRSPRTASTRAGTSGPTDRSTRRRCRWDAGPPFIQTSRTPCSRPTCWGSTEICTASWPRCGSSPGSATSCGSTPSRPWSRRCGLTWLQPGRCW